MSREIWKNIFRKEFIIMAKILLTHENCETIADCVEFRIEMLYDFCILSKIKQRNSKPDPREEKVRKFLLAKKTERDIETALHDVFAGNKTIDQLLKGSVKI
jgi:hypothetical protein